MRLALFGATGKLGEQLARQALGAGHEVCALVRNPARLAADLRDQLTVIEGDALQEADVARVLEGVDHVLFALGCDGRSPPNLCTDSTRLIIARLRSTQRFVWCGGGSNLIEGEDAISFGPRFVRWWAATFMTRKHMDKENCSPSFDRPRGCSARGLECDRSRWVKLASGRCTLASTASGWILSMACPRSRLPTARTQ